MVSYLGDIQIAVGADFHAEGMTHVGRARLASIAIILRGAGSGNDLQRVIRSGYRRTSAREEAR
jgi:hypothetical protein